MVILPLRLRIARAKQSVTIKAVLQQFYLYHEFGSKINCPFHGDKEASAKVYPSGHLHCFACNRSWDVLDCVQGILKVNKLHCLDWLERTFNLVDREPQPDPTEQDRRLWHLSSACYNAFWSRISRFYREDLFIKSTVDYCLDTWMSDVPARLDPVTWLRWSCRLLDGCLRLEASHPAVLIAEELKD